MALVDHKLYRAINPSELLHLNWSKSNKETSAPNILKMIKQFNQVGEWVISELTHPTIKDSNRVKLLVTYIDIAYESYKLANFNGAMALLSGLKHQSIARRKEIWVRLLLICLTFRIIIIFNLIKKDCIPSSSWDKWEEISVVFVLDDNFSSLRKKMKETSPPLIPYLGV